MKYILFACCVFLACLDRREKPFSGGDGWAVAALLRGAMAEGNEKTCDEGRPFVKVVCKECGQTAWWGKFQPWKCKHCGSRVGLVVNLLVMALRSRDR